MTEPLPPRTPPRYVPVLTEVVRGDAPNTTDWQEPVPMRPALFQPALELAPPVRALEGLEEQLIHRVMQRVDVSLEHQLHDAVATMVLQHTHALVPRLREEIEFVVRQAVAEAVAAELAQQRPSTGP